MHRHSRPAARLKLGLAAACVAALAATVGATRRGPAPGVAPAHSNLVLLTLDTTRADHLGAWGWRYAHTPNLDGLARRGTRFVRCDTAAPITLPSHATILTGLLPPRHGVRDNGTFALPSSVPTLATRLRQTGYDTAAVVSAIVLERRHGLDQGFRVYDDDLGAAYALGSLVSERPAEATTAAALAVLADLRPPFLLWVHYYDPHEEYRPPSRFADLASGPNRLYDGEIAYMDEQIGALLAKLPANTIVAAVGDHGEMLGEHGELTHGLLLYRAARRVPLLLAGPGIPADSTCDRLVRTVDVAPTLLALAGVESRGLDGDSLLPLLAGHSEPDRTSYSESFLPFFAYKWYPLRALSDGQWLYLEAPRPSLYRLASDGEEQGDLLLETPRLGRRWHDKLAALLATLGERLLGAARPENVLPDEQRKALEGLGYLAGGGGGEIRSDLPDPRQHTAEAQSLHRAAEAVQQGRCADVLGELDRIVREDPHNFPALSLAGECLRDQGKHEQALGLFRRAAQENELSAVPVASVAGSLLEMGRKQEAEREYRHALALDPAQAESASNLARLLRRRGDRTDALAVLARAIAAGCHAPAVFLERGLAEAEGGQLEAALRDFREAAHRNPTDPVPLENAARAAYQLGRRRESAQLYETALRLRPERGDLWKTLGAIYLYQLDDAPAAAQAFRQALRLEPDAQERARLEALLAELGH